jgi:hypothetical protein
MKSYVPFFILLLACSTAFAQQPKSVKQKVNTATPSEIKIPLEPKFWAHDTASAQFINHRGVSAVKSKNPGGFQVFLKDQPFANGTIEYDVELIGMGFPGINFRLSDDKKTGETFYIRSFGKVSPHMRTTLQYAAIIDGISIWDLSDDYQAGATIYQEGWNHVKLVISGKQMRAYVNDMTRPALQIPELEGHSSTGSISLQGNVIYANFKIIPNAIEGLSPNPAVDLTANDTRYLRKWLVTEPIDFPFGKDIIMPLPSMYGDLRKSELPDSSTVWKPIEAENRGIVNVSRIHKAGVRDQRRLTWLKTTIHSDKSQDKKLYLGFSDEVWVFINGQILRVDKNYFGTPSQKEPGARCTLDNSSTKLPLKEGDNQIMIALANYFYGWGIIARLEDTGGIELQK